MKSPQGDDFLDDRYLIALEPFDASTEPRLLNNALSHDCRTSSSEPTVETAPQQHREQLHCNEYDIPKTSGTVPPGEPQIQYYGLALVFLAPALGGFLYGYDIGATSFVLSLMLADQDRDNWWHQLPKVHQGLMVSCLALGALIGSHIVLLYLANSIGRRKEIRIAATLYIVGTMLNVMSGTVLAETGVFGNMSFGWGFVSLLSGRLLYGVGVAFAMHSAPTYMSEMAPTQVRGAIVSAKETVIVLGIVVGMLMGDLQSEYPEQWTDLYAYSILFAVPMLLLTFRIPRSKRWLLMKGYHDEARESMQFVYKGNVEEEFEQMAETISSLCCRSGASFHADQESDDSDSVYSGIEEFGPSDRIYNFAQNNGGGTDVGDNGAYQGSPPPGLCSPRYRSIMVIGMGLLVAQQFSGQPCVLAYSRVLFAAAGWKGHTSVVTVTIMGFVSTFTVMMVDRLGRKTLLVAGSTIMMVSLGCLAFGFWGWNQNLDEKLSDLKRQVVLWSMFVFISAYQVGFGPITWTVLSEIYPAEIRGTAMALSVEVNFFAKFLTHLFFPIVQGLLGWGQTFLLLGGTVAAGLLFICTRVPETKGMSLEEIQVCLNGKSEGSKNPSGVRPRKGREQIEKPPVGPQWDNFASPETTKELLPMV